MMSMMPLANVFEINIMIIINYDISVLVAAIHVQSCVATIMYLFIMHTQLSLMAVTCIYSISSRQ